MTTPAGHDGMTGWERDLLDTTWVPGDPLLTDNGCGAFQEIRMTPAEREQVIAEGGRPPPWWRPVDGNQPLGASRVCSRCGVTWRGPEPCWMCDEQPQW